jgi:hypothetical protein
MKGLKGAMVVMNMRRIFLLLVMCSSLAACQFTTSSSSRGLRIQQCSAIIFKVRELQLQARQIPEHLLRGGQKQGGEFDANDYLTALEHISMRDGYVLDYVYQVDNQGGYPLLYPRAFGKQPYASAAELPANTEWPNYQDYLEVDDTEQGYFEFVVMDIMADQFYLFWQANYNDMHIVCNRQQVYDIVEQIDSGALGNGMDPARQEEARLLRNIMPAVLLTEDTAVVEVVTFTKWGGFYRIIYTISRESPHKILDVKQENILPYDCGIQL